MTRLCTCVRAHTRREHAVDMMLAGVITQQSLIERAEALRVGLPCLMLVRACTVRGPPVWHGASNPERLATLNFACVCVSRM